MDGFRSVRGVFVPFIIYGTAWKKEKTADLVRDALKEGFRGIDTACQPKHYEEKLVGEALNDTSFHGLKREQIYLQTKYTPLNGQDPYNIPYNSNAPLNEQVTESFSVSLSNLKTDYIDTFILHSPLATLKELMIVWSSMEEEVHNGTARQLGISNCYDLSLLEYLYDNSEIKPAVLQNRFYQETGYDSDLRNFCNRKGIIYQSFWTLTANSHILNSFLFKDLSSKYNKTEAQIFFRFLNHSDVVPLTGTSSKKHMNEDLDILNFDLDDEDVEIIGSIIK